eukprot:1161221-Pelagomonas_calceolata.AAC.1
MGGLRGEAFDQVRRSLKPQRGPSRCLDVIVCASAPEPEALVCPYMPGVVMCMHVPGAPVELQGAPICMHVPGAPVRPQVRTDTLQACPTCVLRGVVGVAVGPPLAARERLPRDAVTVTVARP